MVRWRVVIVCAFLCSVCLLNVLAQSERTFYPVGSEVLKGRAKEMRNETSLGRLPSRLQSQVRGAVWNLGQNAAGVYVDFRTDADTIVVRYAVSGGLSMPHMPTTGVSGVDLYLKEANTWRWAYGSYQFKDTIQYTFSNIGNNKTGIYRLYLPLYNTVKWLEIGVDKSQQFSFVNNKEKTAPIVVYGTSIAQGACVSRPGMAWTNIVGRSLDKEVINLAFSGNGRLEQPVLDLIAQEEAAVYVLDCLPNLAITPQRSEKQLDSLIVGAVKTIRIKHPTAPIILTGHSSAFTPGFMNKGTLEEYEKSTEVGKATFDRLIKEGNKNLYWLDSRTIALDVNSTVDYAHPNDYGMDKIAQAYIRLFKKVLK
ncbi:SGNH/GDSL hydrolase family protein [Sphingobacterium tabacisoli]|uniref:SGNH/GDSL hydrolase family protein n=1 Tax=Sphingobacterium tabacisoli TaxID=2044855 RepID=A0ABW5L0D8_9SPHI|nr:SGNH/GDSL hydrolase family protein [Sphingobacterium tabacisoli]